MWFTFYFSWSMLFCLGVYILTKLSIQGLLFSWQPTKACDRLWQVYVCHLYYFPCAEHSELNRLQASQNLRWPCGLHMR